MAGLKLLIAGHGAHGKDTLAELWNQRFGMTFQSSSLAACHIFLFNTLAPILGYSNPYECYNDRRNWRTLWYELINAYNSEDPARLAREILKRSDCYVGMRSEREIKACLDEGLFDKIVWVEAYPRVDPEPDGSIKIDSEIADYIIYNTGSLSDFEIEARLLGEHIFEGKPYAR